MTSDQQLAKIALVLQEKNLILLIAYPSYYSLKGGMHNVKKCFFMLRTNEKSIYFFLNFAVIADLLLFIIRCHFSKY